MKRPDLTVFKNSSSEEWKNQIQSELKGVDWESLRNKISDHISLEPGYHNDEVSINRSIPNKNASGWLIGESIYGNTTTDINNQLLEALTFGLESPEVLLDSKYKDNDFQSIIKGVYTDFIDLIWRSEDWRQLLNALPVHFKSFETSEDLKRGAFLFPLKVDRDLTEISKAFSDQLSGLHQHHFRYIHIDPESIKTLPENAVDQVSHILAACSAVFQRLIEIHSLQNFPLASIQISISCGDNLLLEIAKIRALRIGIANLLKAMGLDPARPVFINATTDEDVYTDSDNFNRIKGALIGWAMAVGGADRIAIHPGGQSRSSFDRRIARNIQHLLKMESFIDLVQDPAAGSYYLEELTGILSQVSWDKFIELDKMGMYHDGKYVS